MNSKLKHLTNYIARGITPSYTENVEDTITVINQRCIRDFKLDFDFVRLNDLNKRKVSDEKVVQKYDVLVNSTGVGTLGRVSQYLDNTKRTVDTHVTIVRPDLTLIDGLYFGYLIKNQQSTIERLGVGSTGQTELSRESLEHLEVEYVTNIETQKKIGRFFYDLDNKIDNNIQINQTLETMAQAIFKSWFVDFDPVHAKQQAKLAGLSDEEINLAAMRVISSKTNAELEEMAQKSPAEYEKLKITASHFPDEFEESGIPKGWCIKRVDELYSITIGRTPPRKESVWFTTNASDIKWLSIKDMASNNIFINGTSEFLTKDAVDKFNIAVLPKDTVFLSFKMTVGRVGIANDNMSTNEAIAHFVPLKKISKQWTYLYLKNINYNLLGSTSSIVTAINSKIIRNMNILYPNAILLESFERKTENIFNLIRQLEEQTITLTELRDTLLPKLCSGEIEV